MGYEHHDILYMVGWADMDEKDSNEDALGIEDEPEEIAPERVSRQKFLDTIATANDDPLEDLRWVFQALGAKDLTPEDAPSPGAWALLTDLQGDELARKSFYTTVYPKLLPPKSQMDQDDDHADDGRGQFRIIEGLLREPDDAAPVLSDTEERARKLALSRKGT